MLFAECLKEALAPNKYSVNIDFMFYCYELSNGKDLGILWRTIDIRIVR